MRILSTSLAGPLLALASPLLAQQGPPPAPPGAEAAPVAGTLSAVTVYRGQALVTRRVEVPAGEGLAEIVVSPLPMGVVPNSLASEADEGLRVLSTRYRSRAVQEDTREEVRALQGQAAELRAAEQEAQADLDVLAKDLELLVKLEEFTRASIQDAAGKGALDVKAIRELTDYIRTTRAEISAKQLAVKAELGRAIEALAFNERKRQELAAGASSEARDAVLVVDRGRGEGGGAVRLSYLVGSATWAPQYRLRAGADDEPVRVEYLAAVEQQTGEDWADVELTLSTARPQLSAVPPDLLALDIEFGPAGGMMMGGGMGGMGGGMGGMGGMMGGRASGMMGEGGPQDVLEGMMKQMGDLSRAKRDEAQMELLANRADQGQALINEAAALEQAGELLNDAPDPAGNEPVQGEPEAPSTVSAAATSVTYRLAGARSVPSRPDQQLVEVARLDLPAKFFFKAVPVLGPQVYRLATLTNSSEYVLLPGEARMYAGADFVGRMDLPAVAAGEPFTAGFGADPQLQVERSLASATRSTQGGNQVRVYSYKILASSYRPAPVTVQVWDRLPRPQADVAAVGLVAVDPPLSDDPAYLRRDRPRNLLRWDLAIEPGRNRESAATISYEFKLEYSRNLSIQGFRSGQAGSTADGEPVPGPVDESAPAPPALPGGFE
jgi:hypothetical protein